MKQYENHSEYSWTHQNSEQVTTSIFENFGKIWLSGSNNLKKHVNFAFSLLSCFNLKVYTTWERATGRLFDANLPPVRFPLGCWTPLEGTLFNVEFLDPSVPCMLGTLKLPWMLCKPWRDPEKKSKTGTLLYMVYENIISYDSCTC